MVIIILDNKKCDMYFKSDEEDMSMFYVLQRGRPLAGSLLSTGICLPPPSCSAERGMLPRLCTDVFRVKDIRANRLFSVARLGNRVEPRVLHSSLVVGVGVFCLEKNIDFYKICKKGV